ncbi:CLUMA_CG018390, isoform A [Clunio marinus]|uniref:CLUMA_CG018390, isoform A n=1 Tax=Clunio marinus TaxID=568069 RepID=A0A1J1J1L2_9DIPT|nr:CLUMA_CG018390, isoform A [Clunio marinus]
MIWKLTFSKKIPTCMKLLAALSQLNRNNTEFCFKCVNKDYDDEDERLIIKQDSDLDRLTPPYKLSLETNEKHKSEDNVKKI